MFCSGNVLVIIAILALSHSAISQLPSTSKNPGTQKGISNPIKFPPDIIWPGFLIGTEKFNDNLSILIFKNVTDTCAKQFMYALQSFSQLPNQIPETWVLHLFDAWGKLPSGILSGHNFETGDFFECIQMQGKYKSTLESTEDVRGKYCVTYLAPGPKLTQLFNVKGNVTLPKDLHSTDSMKGSVSLSLLIQYIQEKTSPSFAPLFGTCFPDSCTSEDAQQILTSVHTHVLGNYTTQTVATCYMEEKPPLHLRDYAMLSILCLISVLCLAGTLTDVLGQRETVSKFDRFSSILRAFSISTNTRKLMNTKVGSNNLGCLHGMRFLTMAWILLCHTYVLGTSQLVWNKVDLKNLYKDWTLYPILNGYPSVDTFFTLSGVLVSLNLLRELDKKNGRFNYLLFVVHRYLRLTPVYAILLGLLATLLPYTGSGPMWTAIEQLSERCHRYWWQNFLYVSNLVDNADGKCYGAIAWYLSNEMQFFVFSPVVIYPLWKWRKVGFGIVAFLSLVTILIPTMIIFFGSLPPTNIPTIETRKRSYWENYYDKPWARFGSYLVGIVLGYILYLQEKQSVLPRRLSKILIIIGWASSTGLSLAIIYGAMFYFDPKNVQETLNSVHAAAYGGLHRYVWSLTIAWIIFACVNDYGGCVNRILSAKIFVPLGRLAFSMYLVSYHVETSYFFQSVHPVRYSTYNIVSLFFGLMVITGLGAYVLSMTIEFPCVQLEKLIFAPKPLPKRSGMNNEDINLAATRDHSALKNVNARADTKV